MAKGYKGLMTIERCFCSLMSGGTDPLEVMAPDILEA